MSHAAPGNPITNTILITTSSAAVQGVPSRCVLHISIASIHLQIQVEFEAILHSRSFFTNLQYS